MKITLPMMATLGLIMSALPAQATSIPITALPFTITAPGTHVLVANLTLATDRNGIQIYVNTAGNVILNLKGFTLSGLSTRTGYSGVAIGNVTKQ